MIEVNDLGYFARFYDPVNEEVRSKEPIVLTPERMAYDWWGYQAFRINSNGETLMTIHKEYGRQYGPGYGIFWQDFLGNVISGQLLLDKLFPMLDLHADLTKKGLDLGKSRILIEHPTLSKLDPGGGFEAFLLDQTHLPQNQQLIKESSGVNIQSDWLDLFVEICRWNIAGIRSRHYFGVDEIMTAFKTSYFNTDSPALDELGEIGQCLDDIIRNFPEAPRIKS